MKAEENTTTDKFQWDGTLIGVHLTQDAAEEADEAHAKHDITDKGKSTAEKQAEEDRHEAEAEASSAAVTTPADARRDEPSPRLGGVDRVRTAAYASGPV